jgi:cytochrome c peroxidase
MRSWLGPSAAAWLLSACAALDLFGDAAPAAKPMLDPDLVQRGAALFVDPRLSGDGLRACSTCHPGGGADDQVYAAGESVAPGSAGGRRTLSLRGLYQTAPYFWDGSARTLAEAVDRMLAVEMRGGKLEGRNREALEAYLLSLAPFDRRRVEPDGAPVEPATLSSRRGYAVFVKADCTDCHPAPVYTRAKLVDVGTGGRFANPTLRGVSAAGPWGHDGRWPDLEQAVRANLDATGVELGAEEVAQLLEYLKLL